MVTNIQARLNEHSLSSFKGLFASLDSPPLSSVKGIYQSAFVGPRWLRAIAGPGLYPIGLGGWWGKIFDDQGQGFNIVRRHDELTKKLPISLSESPSLIDGRPCLTVIYPPSSSFPWPWVVDELRWLADDRLLGMTLVTRKPLNKMALPFLLTHRPEIHAL